MATLTHLDTHVLVWLYTDGGRRLTTRARSALGAGDLAVSPMALLELGYMHEIGRVRDSVAAVLESLRAELALRVDEAPFAEVVAHVQALTWTRDPFDRLIVAQALAADAVLVTADESIHANLPTAVW